MGCNCGKAKGNFQALVQNQTQAKSLPVQITQPKQIISQPSQPQPQAPQPMTRAEKSRLRGLRIAARNERMAARNAAILAARQSQELLLKKN